MYNGAINIFLPLRPSQPLKYWDDLQTKVLLRNKNKKTGVSNFASRRNLKTKIGLWDHVSPEVHKGNQLRSRKWCCILEARQPSSEHHALSCWLPSATSSHPTAPGLQGAQSSRGASEPSSPPRPLASWIWNSCHSQLLHWVELWFK